MKYFSKVKSKIEKNDFKNIVALSIASFLLIMPVVFSSISIVFIFFMIIKVLY